MNRKKLLWSGAGFTGILILALLLLFLRDSRQDLKPQKNEKETVRIMAPYSSGMHQDILKIVAHDYERYHPEIQIEVEFVPRENYKREIGLRQDEGKNADIIICGSSSMPAFIQMGVFQEFVLDDAFRARYLKTVDFTSTMSDGKFYGVPFTCDPYLLFYNQDALEKKGLKAPKTWEEVLETGQKVQRLGTYGFGFAAKEEEDAAQFYSILLAARGGSLYGIEKEPGISAFEDIEIMKSMKTIPPDLINVNQEDLANRFASGEIQMMVNRLSCLTTLRTTRISFEIGMQKVPGQNGGMVFLTGDNIGLSAQAGEAARDVLEYLCSPEANERLCSAMDVLPVFMDVTYYESDTAEYVGEGNLRQDFLETIDNKFSMVSSAWFSIAEALAQGVNRAMESNPEPPEEIAKEIQDSVRISIWESS